MRLGLVTDIHEAVEPLRQALAQLRADGAEQIVCIGDVFETGERLTETCALLAEYEVTGVWGNHDYGLCIEPDAPEFLHHAPAARAYMATLKPTLRLGECRFTHVEPWLDPENPADLWYFDGVPDTRDKIARIFSAVPQRLLFAGHYHRWLAATEEAGMLDWNGTEPLDLSTCRFFIVIGALCQGRFALYDTEARRLHPYSISIPPENA